MKKIFITLAFACTLPSLAMSQNLVKNGDFETWNSKTKFPQSWNGSERKGVFRKSHDAQSGKNALQIKFTPPKKNSNIPFRMEEYMKLAVGEYEGTFYFKGEGEVRFIALTRKGTNPGSKPLPGNIIGKPTINKVNNKKWTAYKVAFYIPEADEYALCLCFNSGSAETPFLLDNISLIEK